MLVGFSLWWATSFDIIEHPPIIAAAQISDNGSSGPNPAASHAATAATLNNILHPYLRTFLMANGITF
jgi:hypothetical protein